MNKEKLIEELEAKRLTVSNEWQALASRHDDDNYDEDYEDTVTRLTLNGTVTGLSIAIDLIKNGASA